MAATWPLTLPAPQRSGLRITPTSDVKSRTNQSGRKELRRWGCGGGDTLTCTLRLVHNHPTHGDQVAIFRKFWDRNLNFGLNWIDGDWLPLLGYSNHYCRIVGYSPRQGQGVIYSDYSVTFEIKPIANAWENTVWPAEGPGSGNSGTPSVEGLVIGYSENSSYLPSDNLYAVKVQFMGSGILSPYGAAVALKADGTVQVWGVSSFVNTYLSGWESLGGIVDIAGSMYGFLYLTSTGAIGYFGGKGHSHYTIGETMPSITDGLAIYASTAINTPRALVIREGGTLIQWGYVSTSCNDLPTTFTAPMKDVSVSMYHEGIIDADGNLTVAGYSDMRVSLSPGYVCCGVFGNSNTSARGITGYKTDGTWYKNPSSLSDPLTGLVPQKIFTDRGLYGCRFAAAIHSDGTLVGWSPNGVGGYLTWFNANVPSGLKVLQGDILTLSSGKLAFLAIRVEE